MDECDGRTGSVGCWSVKAAAGTYQAAFALKVPPPVIAANRSQLAGMTASAIEAGLGLLGTAALVTLCMTPLSAVASRAAIPFAVRHLAATLVLALVYGIGCVT